MTDVIELVEAVYIGGNALLSPGDGTIILPGDTVHVSAVQLRGRHRRYALRSELSTREVGRLRRVARAFEAAANGEQLDDDDQADEPDDLPVNTDMIPPADDAADSEDD